MIGSLRGSVVDRSRRGEVLIEVGGVGYRVMVPPATLAAVAVAVGEPAPPPCSTRRSRSGRTP